MGQNDVSPVATEHVAHVVDYLFLAVSSRCYSATLTVDPPFPGVFCDIVRDSGLPVFRDHVVFDMALNQEFSRMFIPLNRLAGYSNLNPAHS